MSRTIEIRDEQIAGMAVARKAALATRNLRPLRNLPRTGVDRSWSPAIVKNLT